MCDVVKDSHDIIETQLLYIELICMETDLYWTSMSSMMSKFRWYDDERWHWDRPYDDESGGPAMHGNNISINSYIEPQLSRNMIRTIGSIYQSALYKT